MELTTPYTIVCPKCKTRQTAFIKIGQAFKHPYIKCVNHWGCRHMIIGDDLNYLIEPVIKNPEDLRKFKQGINF
ncbi:MAG: hypothetical protein JWQ54_1808 [Mucilaginibacter sp.]|nr:hypothetical protein [Mucilaginibacter sp.]